MVGNPTIALAPLPAAQRELLVMDLRRGLELVRAQKGFVDQQAALLDAWRSRVRVLSGSAGDGGRTFGTDCVVSSSISSILRYR